MSSLLSTSPSFSGGTLVATDRLREKLRRYCKMEREIKRNDESDSLRLGLGEIRSVISELDNLNEKDVISLCARIKRRKHATSNDLFRLSHAFLQSNNNITAFAKIPGAINVIVKELTGHDSEQQIRACETLCNLSLGDSIVCEKIATFAGSYLITYFYSTETRLKKTSLWVITNIAASGGKGLTIILSQGIIQKLVSFYCNEKDVNTLIDVAVCIDLIVSSNNNILRVEDITDLKNIISSKSYNSPIIHHHVKIIFELIFKDETLIIDENELNYLIYHCLSILQSTKLDDSIENYQKILYSIRIISNLLIKYSTTYLILESKIHNLEIKLDEILNNIIELNNNYLNKEIFWFLKNLMLNENYKFKCSIVKNLRTKKLNTLFIQNQI